MLLQDICKGTGVKTVHDVISVFRRDTSGTTSVLLGEVAKLMKLLWLRRPLRVLQNGHFLP